MEISCNLSVKRYPQVTGYITFFYIHVHAYCHSHLKITSVGHRNLICGYSKGKYVWKYVISTWNFVYIQIQGKVGFFSVLTVKNVYWSCIHNNWIYTKILFLIISLHIHYFIVLPWKSKYCFFHLGVKVVFLYRIYRDWFGSCWQVALWIGR